MRFTKEDTDMKHVTKLGGQAYTSEQIKIITEKQTEKYNLSTQICCESGVRIHEIFTLRSVNKQPPTLTQQAKTNGTVYSCIGKNG